MCKVYVTGMGVVSALGLGKEENRSALLARKSGIGHAKYLNSSLVDKLPVAEVPFNTTAMLPLLHRQENLQQSRLVVLAALAIQEALCDRLGPSGKPSPLTGFINATTVGGMGDVEDVYDSLINPGIRDNLGAGDALDCAAGTEQLARHFGFTQFVSTISTACSSSANAIMYGARLIRHGIIDRAICGGVDTLTRFTLNGFNSLKNIDKQPCRPFDANRNGLNLGEGAAYLVLESEKSINITGATPLAILSGYCNFNEAFHPTAPSPEGEGAYHAMKGAIEAAGLETGSISWINAHGTATINNDEAEGAALLRLFGKEMPAFSSTKSFTGHTLAAAGAIEAVFSIMSIRHGEIYPVLHFNDPMPGLDLVPVTEVKTGIPVNHVLSNSFGFGGNNASLLFSKYA
ncbi:beta-ketoacyl-[acyl-carrier-protein] synthase family protein [Flavihumibacter solisilvae]|uniref:Ketosynthase family 3 (KS3) domain-containing protein n=1 Tax=Flavihumibacter solisilvae TaxID=1349421 RepID=A0A0C1L7T2_9BACT|nr:beta-ketoacyl-[acyl-carrier-protein] synthase family protein [Flavihumibacter solisilvae]KIC95646.1 hypothetical protein OI18_05190 [Flavihumibacter solisilvae]